MKNLTRVALAGAGVWVLACGCSPQKPPPAAAEGGGAPTAASSLVQELTDATFGQAIAHGVVLVDFWAPWCGPCRTQGPIVEQVAGQLGATAKVAKVNVDQAVQTAQAYEIRSIPTLVVFKDGKPARRFVGVTQADALLGAVKAAH